jgi:hypothetical protein
MIRWLALCAVAWTSAGCGLIIDGAYLLSDRKMTRRVEQRRPTGQSELSQERRLAFEEGRLRVACEDVARSVDRVWTVEKIYEYQGGIYQAHWLPVLLEGAIGGGLAIGIGAKCRDPAAGISCNLLYGTIPFGVDVAWSLARLLTIDPPKLVDKRPTAPHTDSHGAAQSRAAIACETQTSVVASDPSVTTGPFRVLVDLDGEIAPEAAERLIAFMRNHPASQVALFSGSTQVSIDLSRCDFFRSLDAESSGRGLLPEGCARAP